MKIASIIKSVTLALVFITAISSTAYSDNELEAPDINDDGIVNLNDFLLLSEKWIVTDCNESNDWCAKADINYSGSVDIEDLQIMSENWLKDTKVIPNSHFLQIPLDGTSTLAKSDTFTTFDMGNCFTSGCENEQPVHTVILDTFYMCKYEVTNKQYSNYLSDALSTGQIIVDAGVVYAAIDNDCNEPYFSTYPADPHSQIGINTDGSFYTRIRDGRAMSDHPVVCVSWHGATAFCDYYDYRLPTEAEWECAAKDGNTLFKYPWATNFIDKNMCNYNMNNPSDLSSYPYTTQVGSYPGSRLYDMSGNVYEWCSDWYSETYYSTSQDSNPAGPETGTSRVIRGGSWNGWAYFCRIANRSSCDPNAGNHSIGFRVCLK